MVVRAQQSNRSLGVPPRILSNPLDPVEMLSTLWRIAFSWWWLKNGLAENAAGQHGSVQYNACHEYEDSDNP